MTGQLRHIAHSAVVVFCAQELCQCFYQLKSFEAELVDASEKSDEDDADDDDDAEGISSCDHEDADQQPNDDSVAATDNIAQQTASAKRTWSQAARDAVQEKIKDMMNVAHVSPLCSKVVSEVHGPKNYQNWSAC